MILVLDEAGLQSLNALVDYILEHEGEDYNEQLLEGLPDGVMRNHIFSHALAVADAIDDPMEGEK